MHPHTYALKYLRKEEDVMLKIKKIKDKSIAQVKVQADPCKVDGVVGKYDCLFDCTAGPPYPEYYLGIDY